MIVAVEISTLLSQTNSMSKLSVLKQLDNYLLSPPRQ